ncbi:hypothetical protein VTL71DRAFT_12119 [Oculimacula yallundae]|uniref:Uncharacterized protein n=1 Tax=Oculimacula yallundae TaxID=86028 RepID=A0ABR4CS33_9HELO
MAINYSGNVKSTEWRGQGNFTTVTDAFPQLTNLTLDPGSGRDPRMGGQNYSHCCLLAVNASLDIKDGFIVQNPTSYIQTTVEDLLAATEGNQFPCTAKYDGNAAGAPVVEVPYKWLETTCPGWQLSRSRPESQWISPFVGFLLPAVVFCLVIPRRRKLAVWNKLFLPDLSQVMSWFIAPVAMFVAGICVTIDTIMWLSICFAFGGPMLLSGFYEAYLDYIIVGFIQEKLQNNRLTIDMRARLLFVILCGNLDLDPEARALEEEMTDLPSTSNPAENDRWPDLVGKPDDEPRNPSSPWTHVENLVHGLRTYNDGLWFPRLIANALVVTDYAGLSGMSSITVEPSALRYTHVPRCVKNIRLTQKYSFGATVGAPVVFFIGTFVFTIVTTLSNLGDNDTSLALAFGMWYMIIPHISIVSGLLLAGNNPNTFEGVVAHEFGDTDPRFPDQKHFGTRIFELAYNSRYRPQWLWFRGRSKRQWVEKVLKTYEFRHPSGQKGSMVLDEDMAALRRVTTLTTNSWGVIIGMTLLLLGIPFALAFLTAFYTPQVGISCRTLTFTVYTITQLCQITLWLWAYAGAPEEGTCPALLRKGGILHRSGFYTPTDVASLRSWGTIFTLRSLWSIIWFSLAIIYGLGGVFTAIGGTVMQLMGVYRSDKCDLNAEWWTRPHDDVPVVISSNSAIAIRYANKYWLACGITATLFLAVVCFCGWWYQRRLRGLFKELVSSLGDVSSDREDIRATIVRE